MNVDSQVYRIQSGSNPLDERFILAVQRYLELSQAQRSRTPFMVVAEGSLSDSPITDGISEENLQIYDQLIIKLRNLSRLLHKLSNSSSQSIWVSVGDCTGMWWEVCQAFTTRLWFGESQQVGFPEMRAGEISPLGILGNICIRNSSLLDSISSEPTINTRAAFIAGWIDAVFPNPGNAEIANLIELYDGISSSNPQTFAKSQNYSSRKSPFKWQEVVSQKREDRFADFKINGTMQMLRELVRTKDTSSLQKDVESILIPTRARELVLSRRRGNTAGEKLQFPELRAGPINTVQVHASGVLPTSASLSQMLRNRMRLALFDQNPTAIVRSSEVIDGRLRKFLNDDEMRRFRDDQLIMFQSSTPVKLCSTMVELELSMDEKITVLCDSGLVHGYALEGHDNLAILGPVELNHECRYLARNLAVLNFGFDSMIFTNWIMAGRMPLSVWIRCIALQAIESLGANLDCNFQQMIQSLKSSGWRFLGDETRILRFLKHRAECFPELDEESAIGNLTPQATSLTAILETLTRRGQPHTNGDRSDIGTELNLAAKVVASTIFVMLAEFGHSVSHDKTDRLVSASLGFPTHGRSVRNFTNDFGPKRILAYARQIFSLADVDHAFNSYSNAGNIIV